MTFHDRHPSPWHAGEVALQEAAGVAARMAETGPRVIRDHLIEQHRSFFPLLPFVVIGSVDAQGDVWATLRAGRPGFLRAPDESSLAIEMRRDTADPAEAGLNDGDAVGLLGLDLTTRRRNRLNGRIRRNGADRFTIAVEQSFGNCPQYIQLRESRFVRDPDEPSSVPPIVSHALDAKARAMIETADTFFVATYVGTGRGRQVDVSHRGGRPGFVSVDDEGVLTIPDFAGNRFFNTLGNIAANPRAGLVFVDFASGDLVQVTGRASVRLDTPEIARIEGAERLWTVAAETVVVRPAALPLRFDAEPRDWSPRTLATGDWGRVGKTLS